jgi:hypothetical protein
LYESNNCNYQPVLKTLQVTRYIVHQNFGQDMQQNPVFCQNFEVKNQDLEVQSEILELYEDPFEETKTCLENNYCENKVQAGEYSQNEAPGVVSVQPKVYFYEQNGTTYFHQNNPVCFEKPGDCEPNEAGYDAQRFVENFCSDEIESQKMKQTKIEEMDCNYSLGGKMNPNIGCENVDSRFISIFGNEEIFRIWGDISEICDDDWEQANFGKVDGTGNIDGDTNRYI